MTSTDSNKSQADFQSQIKLLDDPQSATDLLGREAFAERIAHALSNWKKDESLVVALFGKWGTGKTWLLHRIRAQLKKEKRFTICAFNPWQFESNEQITSEFFTAIFDILPKDASPNNERRAKLWAKLGAMVSVAKIGCTAASMAIPTIAAVNPVLGGIEKLLAKGMDTATAANQDTDTTLSEIRKSLLNLFKEEDAPKILVSIDDLDRLPDEQIQMIFRLLKTTVNFPNLHFLILGERHQLAKALDPVAHNEGDRYMEKIVQIPVYMPEIDSVFLKNHMQQSLVLIANSYAYTTTPQRLCERNDDLWNDFLKIKLTNLRTIYRLLTVVEFKCSALSHQGKLEVDLLDLLSIEYLRLYAPTTYDKVFASIFYLTHGFIQNLSRQNQDNTDALAILENSELGEKGAYHACSHLFPCFSKAVSTWSTRNLPAYERQAKVTLLSSERPICNPSYQPLYFKLSLDEKILSRLSYETVLNETDQTKLEAQLLGLGSDARWLLFQHMLTEDTLTNKVQTVEGWLRALANVSDSLDDDLKTLQTSECRYAYKVWLKLFKEIEPQFAFIEALFNQTEAVTILALLLEDLRDTAGIRFASHKVQKNELLPCLEEEKLSSLSDQLLAITMKACKKKTYPIRNKSVSRLYRLIYAIGPERFENILQDPQAINFKDTMTLALAEATAIVIESRYHISLVSPKSLKPNISLAYFQELQKFAAANYWIGFVKDQLDAITLSKQQRILLEHIRKGIEESEQE